MEEKVQSILEYIGTDLSKLRNPESLYSDIVDLHTDVLIKSAPILSSNGTYIVLHCVSRNPKFNSKSLNPEIERGKEYYIFVHIKGLSIVNYSPDKFNEIINICKQKDFHISYKNYIFEYDGNESLPLLYVPEDYLFDLIS